MSRDPEEAYVYLFWTLSTSGLTSLRAICTDRARANAYRKGAQAHSAIIRAWVERRLANHLYAEGELERNYPDKRLARYLAEELESRKEIKP